MKRLCGTLAVVGVVAVFSAGCGKSHDRAAEKLLETTLSSDGSKVDVSLDTPGEQVNITTQTEKGTVRMSLGGQTQVPQNFPEDVPVYPGLQVLLAHEVVDEESYTVQGTIEQPVNTVTDFYRAEAEKQGWKQESSTSLPEMQNYVFRKGPRVLSVSIVGSEGTTSVTLVVTRE